MSYSELESHMSSRPSSRLAAALGCSRSSWVAIPPATFGPRAAASGSVKDPPAGGSMWRASSSGSVHELGHAVGAVDLTPRLEGLKGDHHPHG
jgi:hypothetical protein